MTRPSSISRRTVVGGLGSLALANSAKAQGTTTLRMWTFLNPAGNAPRERALRDIIAEFEAANPGSRVVVETQAWDQMTPKFLAAARTGGAPDVVWCITDLLGDAIRSGALADLTPCSSVAGTPRAVRRTPGPTGTSAASRGATTACSPPEITSRSCTGRTCSARQASIRRRCVPGISFSKRRSA